MEFCCATGRFRGEELMPSAENLGRVPRSLVMALATLTFILGLVAPIVVILRK